MKRILVINMGLKSVRSILFREDGVKLATAAEPIETRLTDEQVTQDPKTWWRLADQTARECLRDAGSGRVDYITVTTSASCLVTVDSNGNSDGDAIMVSDKRAQAEAEFLAQLPAFRELQKTYGLKIPDASLLLPKLLWVKNHEPNRFAKTAKALAPNDFLIFEITGKFVTDYLNAEKFYYSRETSGYLLPLLSALDLPVSLFPEVVPPGTAVGRIKPELAEAWEINDDAEVIVTSYDAICSFFGSGSSAVGDACDVSGTVTTLRAFGNPRTPLSTKVFHQPIPELDIALVGGSNNLGGGLIEWLRQCYYQNETYAYEVMEQEASQSSVGANGLVFLPYLLGERMPIWDPNVRGALFGLERSHTRGDIARAVFESTGFILRDMVAAIEATDVGIDRIYASGGLARIGLISRLKADITGKTIVVTDEFETTALGAAVIVLVSQGIYPTVNDAVAKLQTSSTTINPIPARVERYDQIFDFYKKLYTGTQELFAERRKLFHSDDLQNLRRINNL